jgi:uracil-DNA glycosylase family 4
MRWSEPQLAMLREMGLRLWLAPAAAAESVLPAGSATAVTGAAAGPGPLRVATAAPLPGPEAPIAVTLDKPLDKPLAKPPASAPAPATASAASAPLPSVRAARVAPQAATQTTEAPSAATPAAALTLDWPALRSAVEDCRACSLCETRHQTVFGVGHLQAHCLIVGEAPGEQEDARGEPFIGESGQLLDRMLRALGLSREASVPADPARQVFITNALKCRPPHNRNPRVAELASCQPFLARQVALVRPRVILAMGRFAVQSLLGSDEPIGKLRGRLHDWHGVPLVVTYHPAYLLRQPADKAGAWDDLCLAATCLDRPQD